VGIVNADGVTTVLTERKVVEVRIQAAVADLFKLKGIERVCVLVH
jgi:hypothetical protein